VNGSGTPIWDDVASSEDLAALQPPRPDRLPRTADVLIVGGGVIGLSIAAFCTDAGMDVVVVEQHARLASGPSGRAAGSLGPDVHPELGARWHALAKRSFDLHVDLDARYGHGLRRHDIVVLPDARVPDQGHVDPLRFCASLARRAGTVLVATAYDDITIEASNVVFATGNAPADANVASQALVKGHLIATRPAPFRFDGIVASTEDDMLFGQLPSGHIIGGGTKEPGVDGPDVDDGVVERIRTVMVRALPETTGLDITHAWTCFRPHVPGFLPVVTRIRDGVWIACGFYSTGILMAPIVGELVADAIASGSSRTDVLGTAGV
jgi:glycine/D-amino acid oxidase-like deaminating enzyme